MNKFDINIIRKYVSAGWLKMVKHDELSLYIVNYTPKTHVNDFWNEITMNCRATIIDEDGMIISKGFPKFFNYTDNKTIIPEKINTVTVYEKLDGSYIGLFYYNNQWIVNSKGSFDSPQVRMARDILKSKNLELLNKNGITYCFELIHPDNKIVVDYNNLTDLVFLSAFENGTELSLHNIPSFNSVKSFNLINFNYNELHSKNISNKEGYVVKFENGQRCKIKFDNYVKIHKSITNITSYDIYNIVKNNGNFNVFMNNVPDELYNSIMKLRSEIIDNFEKKQKMIIDIYQDIISLIGNTDNKTFSSYVYKNHPNISKYLFKIRHKKRFDSLLWKDNDVKPKFFKLN